MPQSQVTISLTSDWSFSTTLTSACTRRNPSTSAFGLPDSYPSPVPHPSTMKLTRSLTCFYLEMRVFSGFSWNLSRHYHLLRRTLLRLAIITWPSRAQILPPDSVSLHSSTFYFGLSHPRPGQSQQSPHCWSFHCPGHILSHTPAQDFA